jgi:hypothetical protein
MVSLSVQSLTKPRVMVGDSGISEFESLVTIVEKRTLGYDVPFIV